MDDKQRTSISKRLSYHLRHRPDEIGLVLGPGGWIEVDALLAALAAHGLAVTRAQLEEVVAGSDKRRFAFDESGARIRASQGHSLEVDLGLEPTEPPDTLYHGTGASAVVAIQRDGLSKMRRHHVHLSPDLATARSVGVRHGPPAIFAVDAAGMRAAGFSFYCSANGVWLVDAVPPTYLRLLEHA